MRAISLAAHGGPEVLELIEADDPTPGPGDLVVDVAAAGVNFIDTYHRTGLYPVTLPYVPGQEGAGVVAAVGDNVSEFSVGDQVAWTGVPGSYSTTMLVPADKAVAVPVGVELDTAAASMLQGLTAHYLAFDTFPLKEGDRCLIHAGAGGVGLILTQLAKMRGAEVFATVGSDAKAQLSAEAGADHVIEYQQIDFADAIEEIAGPRPIDVVYDGVGAATFAGGLRVLRPRGMMITFGNASGPVEPVSPLTLSTGGSLFLTRPTLFDYIATRPELEARADDILGWVRDGSLTIRIGDRLPLSEAAEAHRRLEGRQTTGKVLLDTRA